jgi:hypothetical protein
MLAGVLALLPLGCRSVVGPFAHRAPARVDDPRLTIDEQERRGRDRLALPDERVGPNPVIGLPDQHGYGLPGAHSLNP